MTLFISRLDKAENELKAKGVPEVQRNAALLDSIGKNLPDFNEKIVSARESGATDQQILESFRRNLGRTEAQDVALQIPVAATRVLGAPRAVGSAIEAGQQLLTDPKRTGRNLIRSLAGLEPDTEPEPSAAVQLFGKGGTAEGVSQFLDDLVGGIKDRLSGKVLKEKLKEETVGSTIETGQQFLTDPKRTGRNLIRSLVGLEPDTEPDPSIAEQFLGKDKAQELKETLGFQGLEDIIGLSGKPLRGLSKEESGLDLIAPGFEDLLFKGPRGSEVVDQLSDILGVDLQAQTPPGRIVQETVGTFAETAPLFGTGAGLALARGEGTRQTLEEVGVPKGAAQVAGLGATFLKVTPKPREIDITRKQRNFTAKSISDLEKSFKPLEATAKKGEFKLNPTRVRRTGEKLELGAVDTRKIGQRVARDVQEPLLDNIARDIGTPEQALGTVQEAIQLEFDAAKAETSNFYESAKFQLRGQKIDMLDARDTLIGLGEKITEFGLPEKGKTAFKGFLNDQLELLGDGFVSAEKAIQFKQNLNSFLDFEFPDLRAKSKANKLIRNVRNTAVENLNSGIRRVNRDAFVTWREAELRHAANARRFGKKSVIKLQRAESPLEARGSLKKADELGHLKTAVGDRPEAQVLDRLALEELNLAAASEETERQFTDIKTKLSPRAQDVGESILEIQDPISRPGKARLIQQQIVNDLAQSQALSTYPKFTIDLMVTREGHDLVRRTLNLTPEGRKLIPVVEKAFVQDLFSSFEKGGVIDTPKLNQFLKNPELTAVYERIEGRQALNNLRDLSNRRAAIENVFRERPDVKVPKAKQLPPGLFDFVKNNPGKVEFALGLMKALGISTFRFAKYASGVNLISKTMSRLIRNPKIIANLRGIELRPGSAQTFLIELNKEIKRELDKESKS